MPTGNSRIRRSHASTIRFSILLAWSMFTLPSFRPRIMSRIQTRSRELVLRVGFGPVRRRSFSDSSNLDAQLGEGG